MTTTSSRPFIAAMQVTLDGYILGPDGEADNPAAASEWLGRDPYPRELTYARVAANTPHLVLSTTLSHATWPTARIIADIDELRALKGSPGNAVYVVGGPGVVASLINSGLLDELRLIVHPVVVGNGTPLLGRMAQRQALELVRTEPGRLGRVEVTYRLKAPTVVSATAA